MQVRITIGADLRDRPVDPARLGEAIAAESRSVAFLREQLAEAPNELDLTRLARELLRLSEHLKMADRFEEALAAKEEVLAIWRDLDRRKALYLARLQRATILGLMDRADEAMAEFDALLAEQDETTALYEDFLSQQRGRLLWRRGEREAAIGEVEAALALRKQRGNVRQVGETEAMLATMKAGGEPTTA